MRQCRICEEWLDESLFHRNRGKYYQSRCKECQKTYNKERYASKSAEYSKRYRDSNPEKRKATVKKWEQENRESVRARTNRRRRRLKDAQPSWYESGLVAVVYRKAQEYGLEVDHIIPIAGDNVCGLHCWHNLQLLDSELNKQKSNSYFPDQV